MKKFFKVIRSNFYDIFVAVFLIINLGVILFTEGHTEIMAAVTFWGLLATWKIDNVLDEQRANSKITQPVHIHLAGDVDPDRVEKAVRKAMRDANL